MFKGGKINAVAECRSLAEALSECYATGDVLVLMGRFVQNMEALLLVMREVPDFPEEDAYSDALDLFSTAALNLKYPLFCDISQRLCIAGDGDVKGRIRIIDRALGIVRDMRAWILKQLP